MVLLAGVILAPGRRTVTAALRILGRDRDPDFCTFHRILNRAAWSSRAAAGRLLILLIKAFDARAEKSEATRRAYRVDWAEPTRSPWPPTTSGLQWRDSG